MSSIFLAYLAGVVTILSPCILPLLPIVLGGAISQHRLAPFALAAGLVGAFTASGLLIATVGFSLGLTPKLLNQIAAVVMIAFGSVLLSSPLQERFAVITASATSGIANQVAGYSAERISGQFILGVILGAVWTPCVGPTLGAAIALASQGQSIGYAGTVMFAFAAGTITPLLALMLMTRDALMRRRALMMSISGSLKPALGFMLIGVGLLFLTGLMAEWEAFLLGYLPDRLIRFIYSF